MGTELLALRGDCGIGNAVGVCAGVGVRVGAEDVSGMVEAGLPSGIGAAPWDDDDRGCAEKLLGRDAGAVCVGGAADAAWAAGDGAGETVCDRAVEDGSGASTAMVAPVGIGAGKALSAGGAVGAGVAAGEAGDADCAAIAETRLAGADKTAVGSTDVAVTDIGAATPVDVCEAAPGGIEDCAGWAKG